MTIDEIALDEIENVLARIAKSRALWHSNPDYARFLDIEICALQTLRDSKNASPDQGMANER